MNAFFLLARTKRRSERATRNSVDVVDVVDVVDERLRLGDMSVAYIMDANGREKGPANGCA